MVVASAAAATNRVLFVKQYLWVSQIFICCPVVLSVCVGLLCCLFCVFVAVGRPCLLSRLHRTAVVLYFFFSQSE